MRRNSRCGIPSVWPAGGRLAIRRTDARRSSVSGSGVGPPATGLPSAKSNAPQGLSVPLPCRRDSGLNSGVRAGAGGGQGAPQDMLAQQGAEAAQAPTPFGPPGIPGAEGMGMNPNEGGLPAQMMQPGATREAQTGMTNTGEEALGL